MLRGVHNVHGADLQRESLSSRRVGEFGPLGVCRGNSSPTCLERGRRSATGAGRTIANGGASFTCGCGRSATAIRSSRAPFGIAGG